MAQTIAEQAVDTRLLVSLFQKMKMGDEVSYERMSSELGSRVNGSNPHLISARRIVQRDFNIVIGTIWKVGVKRLNDGEIVAEADKLSGRVRRMARRSVKRVSVARDEALSKDEIVQRNAAVSMAGVLMHIATRSGMSKLEDAVRVNAAQLPVGKTLELFKG